MSRRTKYVMVTGGVVSSIGKGLAAASMGALMEARGLTVTHMKLDPYVNVDPGTMSPTVPPTSMMAMSAPWVASKIRALISSVMWGMT